MQLRVFLEPQLGATYEDQLAVAQRAERLGFDALFRSDHFLTFGDRDPGPGPTDSWVTLGAIARETSTIRLGTMVTSATFRPPGLLAISVAQVDAMSAGRVEIGLGAGWFEAEHRAYGFPFRSLAERFDRLEEQLAIVSGLWATPVGETYSFTGEHYQLADSPALPKPVQPGGPPIIVGGSGPSRTPRLAATYAAEYNVPFADLASTAAAYARARSACEAAGRDPASLRLSHAITVACASTEAEVDRKIEALDAGPLRETGAAGTPEQVAERLARVRRPRGDPQLSAAARRP